MSYKERLMEMINGLVGGEWSVEEFERAYYDFYLESVPDEAISEADSHFFGRVQEMLDWTTERPTEEEQRLGWLTHKEYIDWVRLHRDLYLNGVL